MRGTSSSQEHYEKLTDRLVAETNSVAELNEKDYAGRLTVDLTPKIHHEVLSVMGARTRELEQSCQDDNQEHALTSNKHQELGFEKGKPRRLIPTCLVSYDSKPLQSASSAPDSYSAGVLQEQQASKDDAEKTSESPTPCDGCSEGPRKEIMQICLDSQGMENQVFEERQQVHGPGVSNKLVAKHLVPTESSDAEGGSAQKKDSSGPGSSCGNVTKSNGDVLASLEEANGASFSVSRLVDQEIDLTNRNDGTVSEEESQRSTGEETDEDDNLEEIDEEEESEEFSNTSEVPLTEEEIEELVENLLATESEAASIQEKLEDESLLRLREDVATELAERLSGKELEAAVEEEMTTYIEDCKETVDELEERSALLQEKLEEAGLSLTHLFKWIEKQTPEGCTTDAWRKRTLWVGHEPTQDVETVLKSATEELKVRHPTRSHRGKILDEGASGFLERKLAAAGEEDAVGGTSKCEGSDDDGWAKVEEFLDNDEGAGPGHLMGTKRWAAVYLASTPEQAAQMGLTLPGADIVEEIGDLEMEKRSIYKAALKNEHERGLTEGQKESIIKVREEDDVRKTRRRQRRPRLKYPRPKQVKTVLRSLAVTEEELPSGSLSEKNSGRQSNVAERLYVAEVPRMESTKVTQPSSVPSAGAFPQKVPSKWSSEDIIELLSDDEPDSARSESGLDSLKKQESSLPNDPAGAINDVAVEAKTEDSGTESPPEALNSSEDARIKPAQEIKDGVWNADSAIVEWKPDLAIKAFTPGHPQVHPVLPELSQHRKRAFDGSSSDPDEEQASKKLRSEHLREESGEVLEEREFSPGSSKFESKQSLPVDISSKTSGMRRTVVIDSDGEREVDEAFTGTSPSSYSPDAQDPKVLQCTLTSDRLGPEDITNTCRDGFVLDQEMQIPQTSHTHSSGRKRKARLESDMRIDCTSCGVTMKVHEMLRHPNTHLAVAVCRRCTRHYLSGPFKKDEDGSDRECSWCGEGGDVLCCSCCDKVFCQKCIVRNFGPKELVRIIGDDHWLCFICNDRPLSHLTVQLIQAEIELDRLTAGRQEDASTEFDDSIKQDQYVAMKNPKRGKHRKNIRRLLSDDELEEKQKELLAREKERQDRLEHWRAVFHAPTINLPTSSEYLRPEADKEQAVLADVQNDSTSSLPINFVGDPDEEPLYITPSLARILKPHQVEGVRFMWQNCMESVKKVKDKTEKGVGCILAHSMGLGKTLQVITFLHTVLASRLLETALIVVPVNVLHNWKKEFEMWQKNISNPISVYILDDSIRDNSKRALYLNMWQKDKGVMLMGYTAFRMLALGKHVKDKSTRDSLCESLQNPGPDILVCDEAHMIKNGKADVTQALKEVRTRRRVALTGSPLQNNLMEYFCMVDFVREGFLGTPSTFKNRFQNPIENGQHCDSTARDVRVMKMRAHVLNKTLKGFVQRMDSSVLKDELPPKCVYVISVRLSKLQRRLYEHYIQMHRMMPEVDEASESKAHGRNSLFNEYHVLSKVWNHPDLLHAHEEKIRRQQGDYLDEFAVESDEEKLSDPDAGASGASPASIVGGKLRGGSSTRNFKKKGSNEVDELEDSLWWKDIVEGYSREDVNLSGKMVLLLELLTMSAGRGDKVLVFSQSLGTLNLIEKFMETRLLVRSEGAYWKKDKHWYRLDGNTPAATRMAMCEKFNNPNNTDVKCVLISTRAGSLGINLPAANRVIIVDGSWNPTYDLQALFRAWRLGQKKRVFAYRLLACGTMEERIYNRQVAKEGVAARVLDKNYPERIFNGDDLEFLFKLEPDDGGGESNGPFLVPEETLVEQSDASTSRGLSSTTSTTKNRLSAFHIPDDAPPKDDIMGKLLLEHRPRWIVRYHEHEPLLEHQETEDLSKEDQMIAWENIQLGHGTQDIPTQNTVTTLSLSHTPSTHLDELQTLGSKSVQCSNRDHAAILNEKKVEVNEQIACEKCNTYISWTSISSSGKQHSRGHLP